MYEISTTARQSQPYSDIGLLMAFWPDGSVSQGSCAIVGKNDILTATHVVYSPERGGWATDFKFYFGADYNSVTDRIESPGYSYIPDKWNVIAWPDQTFVNGDNMTMTSSETAYDIALIGVSRNLGNTLGWLGMSPGYDGAVTGAAIGYPDGGTGMMREDVTLSNSKTPGTYTSTYSVLGPGSSGGPLLIGNSVIGVKSTGTGWADIGTNVWDELIKEITTNDSLISVSNYFPGTVPKMTWASATDNYGTTASDTLNGTSASENFYGKSGHDIVNCGAGDDHVWGDVGDDWIVSDLGNDVVDGGPGLDTARFKEKISSFIRTPTGERFHYWTSGPDGVDEFKNVERFSFVDKSLAFDVLASEHAGQAMGLIGVISPTKLGDLSLRGSYISRIDSGASLYQLSQEALSAGKLPSELWQLANSVFYNVIGEAASPEMATFLHDYAVEYGSVSLVADVARLALNAGLNGYITTGLEYM